MNTDSRAKARFMTKAAAGLTAVTAGVLGIWAGALVACRQELAAGSPQAYGAQRYEEVNWKQIPFERVEALTTEGQTTALKLYFGGEIDGVDLTAGSVTFHDPLRDAGGIGANKGRVYRGTEAHSYVAEVDGIRTNGTIEVYVQKGGYRFKPEIHRVEVQGKINTPTIEVQFVSVTQNGSPDKATTMIYAEFEGPERPPLGDYEIIVSCLDANMWTPEGMWSYHSENGDKVKITRLEPWLIGHILKRGRLRIRPCKNGLHFTPEWRDVEVFPWVEGRDIDPGVLPWPLDYLTQRSATLRQDGTPVGSDPLPTRWQAP